MATIAVYSLKGGVGKTTLAVNLAWCAATLSARRTLLWDLDPQAASTYLLPAEDAVGRDTAHAIFTRQVSPQALARATRVAGLDIIAADTSLRALDHTLHALDKKKRLAKLLASLDTRYERIILDCPPGLTETTEQVVRAADLILVPVIPSPLAQRAYEEIARHFRRRAGTLVPVHAMVDRRRTLHREAVAADPDWPVIPMASGVEAMAARRKPIGAFQPASPAAAAFEQLWRGVEVRLARLAAAG